MKRPETSYPIPMDRGFSLLELIIVVGLAAMGGLSLAKFLSLQSHETQKLYQSLASNDLEKSFLAVTQDPISCSSIFTNLSFDSSQVSTKINLGTIKTKSGITVAEPGLKINPSTQIASIELSNITPVGNGKFTGEWLISLRSLNSQTKAMKPIKLSAQTFKVDTSIPTQARITDCLTAQGTSETQGKPWLHNGNDLSSDPTASLGTRTNHDIIFRLFNQISGQIRTTTVAMGYNPMTTNSASNVSIGAFANGGGSMNTALGFSALSNYSGYEATALGHSALANQTQATNTLLGVGTRALTSSTSGFNNVAIGYSSMASLLSGQYNTALGSRALEMSNGTDNIAVGFQSLPQDISGTKNICLGENCSLRSTSTMGRIAIGNMALSQDSSGARNTAVGWSSQAGVAGSAGTTDNTSIGFESLKFNVTGNFNSALGAGALTNNSSGLRNTAGGDNAMVSNTTGNSNTSFGSRSLFANLTGNDNTAIGFNALSGINADSNTAFGFYALSFATNGGFNTGIGSAANIISGPLTNSTAIGNDALANASNKIRLGNSSITAVESPVPVSSPSDKDLKKEIDNYLTGLDFILKLRARTYFYKSDLEKKEQIGFIAQEVEETRSFFPGLLVPRFSSEHYALRYSEFVVPITNAIKEIWTRVTFEDSEDKDLDKKILALEESIRLQDLELKRLKGR